MSSDIARAYFATKAAGRYREKEQAQMKLKRHLGHTAASWGVLLAFMCTFRPAQLPVFALIVPFVLLFAALYSLWGLLEALRQHYSGEQARPPHRRFGAVVCASLVLLLVLQSLGQLLFRDVITLLGAVVLGYLYLTRSQYALPKR